MCLFFASQRTFAVTALRTLIDAGLNPTAVVAPRGARAGDDIDAAFRIYRPQRLQSVCASAGVTLVESDGTPSVDFLRAIVPESVRFIVCLCFPFRLPESVLNFPTEGCLNLHPSALPAYRGPAPLFWQLRAGESQSAVTLHRMNPRFDAGDIVAQTGVQIPVGISTRALEQSMGEKGARLIHDILAGSMPEARVQDDRQASYFSWPTDRDFEIETTWSAERAFRFMRGTAHMGRRYSIDIGEQRFSLISASVYRTDQRLGKDFEKCGADMKIQFSPGVLQVLSADAS